MSKEGRSKYPVDIDLYEGDDVVEMLTHYAEQQGYSNPDWEFWGPTFKPEDRYMTHEGYPLGTVVWYVKMQLDGLFRYAFGDTFEEAAWEAHNMIYQYMNDNEV